MFGLIAMTFAALALGLMIAALIDILKYIREHVVWGHMDSSHTDISDSRFHLLLPIWRTPSQASKKTKVRS